MKPLPNKHAFIKAGLRTMSLKWPARSAALKAAAVGKRINESTGRMAMHFECVECKGHFPAKGVNVDHINPIVPLEMNEENYDWNVVLDNLFCPVENLQILCRSCHKLKSKVENEQRLQLSIKE